jgi:hypothetical protein
MIYLSMEEIERRANFNKAHAYSFGWKDHRETMEMKTTLLALLRLADLTSDGMQDVKAALETIDEAEQDATTEECDFVPEGEITDPDMTAAEAAAEELEISEEEKAYINACTFQVEKKGVLVDINSLADTDLQYLAENGKNEAKKNAAQVILNWRDKHPKRTADTIISELY